MSEEKPKIRIDSCSWGKIVVNGQKYDQVLIVGDEVLERDREKLERLFGTTHVIGEWEEEKLLSQNPEIVLIGTGWSGVLKVSDQTRKNLENAGIEVKIALTPLTVSEFNRLIAEGKRVNALIHTTC